MVMSEVVVRCRRRISHFRYATRPDSYITTEGSYGGD